MFGGVGTCCLVWEVWFFWRGNVLFCWCSCCSSGSPVFYSLLFTPLQHPKLKRVDCQQLISKLIHSPGGGNNSHTGEGGRGLQELCSGMGAMVYNPFRTKKIDDPWFLQEDIIHLSEWFGQLPGGWTPPLRDNQGCLIRDLVWGIRVQREMQKWTII